MLAFIKLPVGFASSLLRYSLSVTLVISKSFFVASTRLNEEEISPRYSHARDSHLLSLFGQDTCGPKMGPQQRVRVTCPKCAKKTEVRPNQEGSPAFCQYIAISQKRNSAPVYPPVQVARRVRHLHVFVGLCGRWRSPIFFPQEGPRPAKCPYAFLVS